MVLWKSQCDFFDTVLKEMDVSNTLIRNAEQMVTTVLSHNGTKSICTTSFLIPIGAEQLALIFRILRSPGQAIDWRQKLIQKE